MSPQLNYYKYYNPPTLSDIVRAQGLLTGTSSNVFRWQDTVVVVNEFMTLQQVRFQL